MDMQGQAGVRAGISDSAAGTADALAAGLRRSVFALLAGLILFGPVPGQVFGKYSPALRNWVMFSGVGVGMLRGEFRLMEGERVIAVQDPLQALGLERYPRMQHYFFEHRVLEPADMAGYALRPCAAAGPGQTVVFAGVVGTRQGWRPMPVADVCALIAPERAAAALTVPAGSGMAR